MKERSTRLYYCEHCNKHMHTKPAMERHEKYCTMNPNRQCKMCDWMIDHIKDFANDLESIKQIITNMPHEMDMDRELEDIKSSEVKQIMEAANGCSACTLAALRQTGMLSWYYEQFDYQKEKKAIFEKGELDYVDADYFD